MAIVALADKATDLLLKLKPIQKALQGAIKLAGKVGVGGVTQDRFIARCQEVYNLFDKYGYTGKGEITYSSFKIGASQVDDRKTNGNYSTEFERLRQYVIARLNSYNPGLGAMYNLWAPAFPMAITSDGTPSLGQMSGEPLTMLKDFLSAYPPGTYKPGDIPAPDRTVTPDYSGGVPDLTQSKLAAGDPENPNAMASLTMPSLNTVLIMVAMIVVVYLFYKFSKTS